MTDGTGIGRKRSQEGFSLVEVIIAMGVLASVLVSIASMFLLGGRQVKAGKTMTEATALVHDIMESFDSRSFTALYTDLGVTTPTTSSTHTVSSATGGSAINGWQTEIRRKLENGTATATIQAMGPGTPTFDTATGLRLTISLTWTELGRTQTVRLSTVRF